MIARQTDDAISKPRSQRTETLRLTLIADSCQGPTAKMLLAGIDGYNNAAPESKRLSLKIITFSDFDSGILAGNDCDFPLILVAVSEPNLSYWEDKKEVRAPSPSIEIAQSIARASSNHRVFLIPVPGLSLTGIDVVAALLSGISGIVDERGLVLDGIVRLLVDHHPVSKGIRSMLLFGYSANAVQSVKHMIADWYMDDESDDTHDLYCWRAGMALAQLEKLEPIIGGSPQPYSYTQLAKALNLAEPITAFRLAENDLRRVISTLIRKWLRRDHASSERGRLPEYARGHGFPIRLPYIPGIDDDEMSKRLYYAFRDLEIVDGGDSGVIRWSLVRLPMRKYRRYSRYKLHK